MLRTTISLALLAPACALRAERVPQTVTSRRAAVSGLATFGLLGVLPAFADEEEYISPAKAKILAAKKAGDSKLGERGQKAPEAVAVEIKVPTGTSTASTDLFAEANALRAKINVLQEEAGERKLSKSKSASLNQLKQKEALARERAQELFAKEQAKIASKEMAKSEADDGDKFAKVTGIKLPSAPSLPF